MNRFLARSIAAAAAALLAVPLIAAPAEAAAIPSTCRGQTLAGAGIDWFPASPGAQSALQVSCRFDASTGTSQVANSLTIHDAAVAQYHNGAARSVTGNASPIAAGATTFTITNCVGLTGYVNRPISRIPVPNPPAVDTVQLPPRAFVKSISAGCVVTLSEPTLLTPPVPPALPGTPVAVPGGTQFKIDNAIARSVDDAVTYGTTTITSATANFTAADVGLSVDGAVAPGSTIATVVNSTTATLSSPTVTATTGQVLYLGNSLLSTSTRQVNLASTPSTTTVNSARAQFKVEDVGLPITGSCTTPAYTIPANTYILSVAAPVATTSGGLVAGAVGCNITIGDPSVTAPVNGEMMATQLIQMDLNPAFAAGVDECANGTLEAFSFPGQWMNPGSFVGGLFNTQPAGTKAIGQILFRNAGGASSAYVIERGPFTAGDPNGSAHYDLVFPLIPISFAICASASSPGVALSIEVKPVTLAQGNLPAGTGKPGSVQIRGIRSSPTAGYTDSVTITSNDPAITYAPAAEFTRLCIFPAPGGNASFQCGRG